MSTRSNLHEILAEMGLSSHLRGSRFKSRKGEEDVDEYVIYVQLRKASSSSEFGEFFYCSYVRRW